MRNTILNQRTGAAVLSFAVLVVPMIAGAQSLIPCGGKGQDPCEFKHLIILANKIISFLMYSVAVPLAALGFMWAGGNLVLNQNKEGAWNDAKSSFGDIGMGFGIMLGAFVLIKFILFAFLSDEQATFVNFIIE